MNISFLKEKGNKYLIYILLGILVLIVILPTDGAAEKNRIEVTDTAQDELETRLEAVLSSMEGVGRVRVMITTEEGTGSVFGEEKKGKVCGVVVVAEGAGNPTVNQRISDAVKALFSVDVHKISIVKMRTEEGKE